MRRIGVQYTCMLMYVVRMNMYVISNAIQLTYTFHTHTYTHIHCTSLTSSRTLIIHSSTPRIQCMWARRHTYITYTSHTVPIRVYVVEFVVYASYASHTYCIHTYAKHGIRIRSSTLVYVVDTPSTRVCGDAFGDSLGLLALRTKL